jgi:hypothetical protein
MSNKNSKNSRQRSQGDTRYTEPALRARLKDEILASDKGGKPGQWSARKAQLLTQQYERAGGGYTGQQRSEAQRHLKQWTEEEWTTASGDKARHDDVTERYLPREAWERLSAEERQATQEQKRAGSRQGKQFIPNTDAARQARKTISDQHTRKSAPED